MNRETAIGHIIDPGQLDRRITIQTYGTPTLNAFGEESVGWTTLATVWANLRWIGGGEKEEADQEIATTDIVATIRRRSDIDEKMRVVYDSLTYDIIHINEMGRRRFQQLRLKRVV